MQNKEQMKPSSKEVLKPLLIGLLALISFPLTREVGMVASLVALRYTEVAAKDLKISLWSVWLSILLWFAFVLLIAVDFVTSLLLTVWKTNP